MLNQLTLAELKRRGDRVFADAQDAIDTARQIIHTSRELNVGLRRTVAELKKRQESYQPFRMYGQPAP
jgi:hypothetical protein